jgi:hypothetical protein
MANRRSARAELPNSATHAAAMRSSTLLAAARASFAESTRSWP